MSLAADQAAGASPREAVRDDAEARWSSFARHTVLVLAVSSLASIGVVACVTTWRMGGHARSEQQVKADELAALTARLLFVPASLGDSARARQAVEAYLDDPDLVRLVVTAPLGRELAARDWAPPGRWTVESTRAIRPPREARGHSGDAPVGSVTVTLDLARKYGVVLRTVLAITALCALLLLEAVHVDLLLIRRMTARLRRLVEEAQLSQKLEASNRELEQFAFVASHDLQEPLRKIISFCQLLETRCRGRLDDESDALFAVIKGAAERMRALINDLLAYARVGSQGAPFQPTDCGAAVREALGSLEESVRESGAAVTCGDLPVVPGDSLQLSRLFQNLIGNAIKFRGLQPPRVRVDAERNGDGWRIDVSDNGIGIDPKYHDRVFEMFKRLHPRDKYPGTGVGLAVCRKIVERHGGRIWLDSEPGDGTVFHFTLKGGDT